MARDTFAINVRSVWMRWNDVDQDQDRGVADQDLAVHQDHRFQEAEGVRLSQDQFGTVGHTKRRICGEMTTWVAKNKLNLSLLVKND